MKQSENLGIVSVRYICKAHNRMDIDDKFLEIEVGDEFFLTGRNENVVQLTHIESGLNILVDNSDGSVDRLFDREENSTVIDIKPIEEKTNE